MLKLHVSRQVCRRLVKRKRGWGSTAQPGNCHDGGLYQAQHCLYRAFVLGGGKETRNMHFAGKMGELCVSTSRNNLYPTCSWRSLGRCLHTGPFSAHSRQLTCFLQNHNGHQKHQEAAGDPRRLVPVHTTSSNAMRRASSSRIWHQKDFKDIPFLRRRGHG